MPFQGSPWTEFISCPVCCKLFNENQQRPISLGCGHTVCKSCIRSKLNDNRCPFDQIVLPNDVDKLPANFALMHLVGAAVPEQEKEAVKTVSDNPKSYEQARKCIEEMAVHLKPLAENPSDDDSSTCSDPEPQKGSHSTSSSNGHIAVNSNPKCVLSRPMQRKLISLIHCQLLEEEGRARAARIARSLGERIVSELLVLHQYPHQLSANLWAAVRTRGCQFLGPAMQEEVLKLILLALEDGSFLSRKVLVLFVVQRLENRYPQASKTAIGHVVQLLYRASCFKVLKRDEESSLMQLKEEFRQYESLRREHDSQIVQIAIEAGLRISPEHWSSLLYGDPAHKSHMQSIIDKHQSPLSFAQSIPEIMSTLQRSSDPCGLQKLQPQLEFLSNIDPSTDCPAPSWENLEAIMRSLNTVMTSYVQFLSNPDHRSRLDAAPIQNTRYKTSMCRDFSARGTCPRGNTCTFAHSQEELERYRSRSRRNGHRGSLVLDKTSSSLTPSESDQLRHVQLLSKLKLEASNGGINALGMLGKSQSVLDLLDSKSGGITLQDAIPLFNKLAGDQSSLSPQQKVSFGSMSVLNPRQVSKQLDPEKPPFIPPTSNPMMYRPPTVDSPDCSAPPPLVLQNSYLSHVNGSYHHSNLPPAPFLCNHTIPPPPPYPPHSLTHNTSIRPLRPFIIPPMVRGSVPLNSSTLPLNTCSPYGPCYKDGAIGAVDVIPDLACSSSCVSCVTESCEPHHQSAHSCQALLYSSQGRNIEHWNVHKQEMLSQVQASPYNMDHTSCIYGPAALNSFVGPNGINTVLANNARKRDSMPTHVSDMYVATRTTQRLENLVNDDSYSLRWSNGEDILSVPTGNTTTDVLFDPLARGPCLDSCTTNSVSFSMAVAPTMDSLFESAGSSKLYTSLTETDVSPEVETLPQTSSTGDSEFSSFPRDDGDENFIPFEHTSVSKFGPISRLNRMKMINSAPVQVTADSFKQINPVLAATTSDRPLSTTMTVPSRFPTATIKEGLVLPVRPTASLWNQSKQINNSSNTVKCSNLTEGEDLAQKLQEISRMSGRVPEPSYNYVGQKVYQQDIKEDNKKIAVTKDIKSVKYGDQRVMQQMMEENTITWPGLKK